MNKRIYDAIVQISGEIIKRESSPTSKKNTTVLDKNASFMESLEVDSLLALEIVSRIEKKFGIKLQEEDFVHFDTLENIADLVERKMGKVPPKVLSGKKAQQLKVVKIADKKKKIVKASVGKKVSKSSKNIKAKR